MNNDFFKNTKPHEFTLIAVAVGYALVGNLNVNEQNSLGNWLIMMGQYLLTHAAQQQLIEGRLENYNININSKKCKQGGSFYTDNNQAKSNQTQRNEVDFLIQEINKIKDELKKMNK